MNHIGVTHDVSAAGCFKTGVSLHGHTLHSRETLDFVYRMMKDVGVLRSAIAAGERRYRAVHGTELNLGRAYWTPPVAPLDAYHLEEGQVNGLGLRALVSLTDHDSIDAPLSLHVIEQLSQVPVSVEWTVPYDGTFLHIGVHNLNAGTARETMASLAAYTHEPGEALPELLEAICRQPQTLVVFNHPLWDEKGIGAARHRAVAHEFLQRHQQWIHAVELNGMRPWHENKGVLVMATEMGKPPISGGDRHALEPNTILNLTTRDTFAEFAAEVRGGHSNVLIMPRYREHFAVRILQNLQDVLAYREGHGWGWKRWDDRVFYVCDDGQERPLSALWGNRPAVAARMFVAGVEALRHPHLHSAFRLAFARRQETFS